MKFLQPEIEAARTAMRAIFNRMNTIEDTSRNYLLKQTFLCAWGAFTVFENLILPEPKPQDGEGSVVHASKKNQKLTR